MKLRLAVIGAAMVLMEAGMASAGDLPPLTGLPPITWTGPTCTSYREWQALPYIYRYCTRTTTQGYEVQRDDYKRLTGLSYKGSELVDCDSTEGWKPPNGNMKTYYCP